MKNLELHEITRIGVYGVMMHEGKMLLVRQPKGPYSGKLDFPGGGIEFGESPEQALRREVSEEIAMEFDSLRLIDNLSATIDVSSSSSVPAYRFFHIGLIYQLEGSRSSTIDSLQELQHIWVDPQTLSQDQCSSLLWIYKQKHLR